jgi:hypothetical protein
MSGLPVFSGEITDVVNNVGDDANKVLSKSYTIALYMDPKAPEYVLLDKDGNIEAGGSCSVINGKEYFEYEETDEETKQTTQIQVAKEKIIEEGKQLVEIKGASMSLRVRLVAQQLPSSTESTD